MSVLKPCPFCGKMPDIDGKVLRHITKRCVIGDLEIIAKSKEQVIEIWNRREGC